jgi:hypothetical protein
MNIASRTPEGEFNHCLICGHDFWLEVSRPPGDAACPNCGCLVWFRSDDEFDDLLAVETAHPRPLASRVNGELTSEDGGSIALSRAPLVIGRNKACDILVDSPKVSKVHCVLSFEDGYWVLRDLKSSNGTKVNGLKVSSTVLAPGDKLNIGKTKYTIPYVLPSGDT